MRSPRWSIRSLLFVLWCVGCGVTSESLAPRPPPAEPQLPAGGEAPLPAPDAGADAGADAGLDAGIDAGIDAGTDVEAGPDAGPAIDAGVDAGTSEPPPATKVYILRHAEKATADFDTELASPLGFARARAWVDILAPHAPKNLYVSNLQRTQHTLQPLAERLALPLLRRPDLPPDPLHPVNASDSAALARELLSAHRGEVSVVCWHTPLVEDLALALGVPAAGVPTWGHDTYDHLWIVTVPQQGAATLEDTVPPFVLSP